MNFLLQNVLFVGKWDICPDLVLIIPKDSMLMVVAADYVALWNSWSKIVLNVRTQIKWSQLVTGSKGMSADYEEILNVPKWHPTPVLLPGKSHG